MAEARSRDEWSRTAPLMALLANCHRDPKKTRAFKPSHFDPFTRVRDPLQAPISVLRDVFLAGRPPATGTAGGENEGKQ